MAFGRLMTDCGFSPEVIREIEFPDFVRYCDYCARHPSLRDLVEAIAKSLGIEFHAPVESRQKYMTGEELKRFVDMTGGKIPGVGQHG